MYQICAISLFTINLMKLTLSQPCLLSMKKKQKTKTKQNKKTKQNNTHTKKKTNKKKKNQHSHTQNPPACGNIVHLFSVLFHLGSDKKSYVSWVCSIKICTLIYSQSLYVYVQYFGHARTSVTSHCNIGITATVRSCRE